jgi:crotonobetainyl-CoA:carnitine CoA-transferase CaiB-like acyl-CoA transferase
LDGLLVLGLEQAVAAPLCTCRMADAGARVIKVERPGGDFARRYDSVAKGESAYFVWLNRGKESLVADLRNSDDRALVERIISCADVLVENLKPGALERLGLAPQRLMAQHPRLVVCSLSGYGAAEAYRERKAYDLLIQAESGLASITGAPEAPGRVGVSVADIAAGMYAYEAVLEALLARGRTGRGRHIEVSLFDALADWMTVPLLHHDYGGRAPGRVGLRHPSIAPYGAYETADGRMLLLSIQNEPEWERLCGMVLNAPAPNAPAPNAPTMAADPRYSDNEARVANRPALEAALQEIFNSLTFEDAAARLDRAGIAFAALNGVAELSDHPALRRSTVATAAGEIRVPAPPSSGADTSPGLGAVPALGEHSQTIRREFAEG